MNPTIVETVNVVREVAWLPSFGLWIALFIALTTLLPVERLTAKSA